MLIEKETKRKLGMKYNLNQHHVKTCIYTESSAIEDSDSDTSNTRNRCSAYYFEKVKSF